MSVVKNLLFTIVLPYGASTYTLSSECEKVHISFLSNNAATQKSIRHLNAHYSRN